MDGIDGMEGMNGMQEMMDMIPTPLEANNYMTEKFGFNVATFIVDVMGFSDFNIETITIAEIQT